MWILPGKTRYLPDGTLAGVVSRPRHSPMLRPAISRIPLLFVWPGTFREDNGSLEPVVSMIDVLPTILDLVGLPLPEVMQGQSLAPVLLGEGNVGAAAGDSG